MPSGKTFGTSVQTKTREGLEKEFLIFALQQNEDKWMRPESFLFETKQTPRRGM